MPVSHQQQFGRNANELIKQAAKRQQELKDPQLRDDLAAARAVLKKHSTMLLTASKVYVRHPELDLAKKNRDFVLKQVCEAVNTIGDVAQGKSNQQPDLYSGAGALAAALDDFDVNILSRTIDFELDPLNFGLTFHGFCRRVSLWIRWPTMKFDRDHAWRNVSKVLLVLLHLWPMPIVHATNVVNALWPNVMPFGRLCKIYCPNIWPM